MKKENIICNHEVVAMVIYAGPISPGVHFYSEDNNSLQVGKQLRKKGERIKSHRHHPVAVDRQETLQEVLYIEKGRIKVLFYDQENKIADSRILQQGDIILLIKGGHGFEVLEETVMIEVKQGPYDPDATEKFEEK